MSKIKAIDKIYFDFHKTFDIDLHVTAYKEREYGLDDISMNETLGWNSEKFQFTSHFDMKNFYQVRAPVLCEPITVFTLYLCSCVIFLQLNQGPRGETSFELNKYNLFFPFFSNTIEKSYMH